MQRVLAFLSRHPRFTVLSIVVGMPLVFILYLGLFGERLGPTKRNDAWMNCQFLVRACKTYGLENGKLPVVLEDLAMAKRPFAKPSDLIDPWGRPYQYHQRGGHNESGEPEVYSLGPDPTNPKDVIGSWMTRVESRQ